MMPLEYSYLEKEPSPAFLSFIECVATFSAIKPDDVTSTVHNGQASYLTPIK